MDIDLVHAFLSGESYWVPGIRREFVERAIEHSICFGVYENERQIAFARVISDCAGFAWLADVFVVAEHRGGGVGKRLIAFVLDTSGSAAHPPLHARHTRCARSV